MLLEKEKEIEQRIRQSDDRFKECIKYVCAGNYIDFSAVENISEQVLEELLNHTEAVSEEEYSQFIKDLEKAHRDRSSKGFLKRQRKSYWMPI